MKSPERGENEAPRAAEKTATAVSGIARQAVHLEGRLDLAAGQASEAGLRAANEDCMGLRVPEGAPRTFKGIAAVVADGVSSAEAGREAAEVCVQN
ncbi:MAG: hypothetical protein VCB25_06270, partial [Myxococcota bacterium]